MKTQKATVRTLDPQREQKAPESPARLLSYIDALLSKCEAFTWLEREIDSGELYYLIHRGHSREDQDRAGWIRSVCRDTLEAEFARLRALAGQAEDLVQKQKPAA